MRKFARRVEERWLTRYIRRGGGLRPPQKAVVVHSTSPEGDMEDTISAGVEERPYTTSSSDETSQQFEPLSWPATEALEEVYARYLRSAEAINDHCTVCFEELYMQNSAGRKITLSCRHEPNVCRSCLATSISTQFASKAWNQIGCPACGERLGFQDVKDFAEPEIFERYKIQRVTQQGNPQLTNADTTASCCKGSYQSVGRASISSAVFQVARRVSSVFPSKIATSSAIPARIERAFPAIHGGTMARPARKLWLREISQKLMPPKKSPRKST